jgi:hypothetical protein
MCAAQRRSLATAQHFFGWSMHLPEFCHSRLILCARFRRAHLRGKGGVQEDPLSAELSFCLPLNRSREANPLICHSGHEQPAHRINVINTVGHRYLH